jgi:peroxiredoxin
MVVAGGFLIGAILFAQVANPVHRVFDPLQIEGFISIKQLFSPKAHRVPIKAHDLTITTIEGKDVTLEDLCGLNQLVVINFWATWCRPCIEEMPALERMHTAYRHNGIAFLGIATQDSAPKVREFVAQHNITYEIAMDKEDQITNAFGGVKTLPTTVFLDNKGNIVKIHKGYLAQRELELHLKNLLPK